MALEEDQPQELCSGASLSAPSLSHSHRQPHPWCMGLLAGGGALFTDSRSRDSHIVILQVFLRLRGLGSAVKAAVRKEAVLPGENLPGVNQSFLSPVPSSTVAELTALYSSARGLSSLLLQGRDCASVILVFPRPWHRGHVPYMMQKAPRPQVLKSTFLGELGWGEGLGY